jgi:hypothetical protein
MVLAFRGRRRRRRSAGIEAAGVVAAAGAALAATRLWMRRRPPADPTRRVRSVLHRTFPFGGADPVAKLIDDGRGALPPDRGRLFDVDGIPADDAIRAAADPASDGTSGPAAENALGPATGGTPGPGASPAST